MNMTVSIMPVEESRPVWFIFFLILHMVIGILGNLYVVVAMIYVRTRYTEKKSLKPSSVTMVLHLSLCDLLYSAVGLTHFVWRYFKMEDDPSYEPDEMWCKRIAIFRNLIVWATILTTAMISFCVASNNLCRTCRRARDVSLHHLHDSWFGGYRVYLWWAVIWIMSFTILAGDILEIQGKFMWTHTVFGCDMTPANNIHPFICIMCSGITIIICYASIFLKHFYDLFKKVYLHDTQQTLTCKRVYRVCTSLIVITVYYWAFILPLLLSNSMWVPWKQNFFEDETSKMILALFYWSLYALNFPVLYVTSPRIREISIRLLEDCCFFIKTVESADSNRSTEDSLDADSQDVHNPGLLTGQLDTFVIMQVLTTIRDNDENDDNMVIIHSADITRTEASNGNIVEPVNENNSSNGSDDNTATPMSENEISGDYETMNDTTAILVNENDSTSSRSSETKNSSIVGLVNMNDSSNGSDDNTTTPMSENKISGDYETDTTAILVNKNDSTNSRSSEAMNSSTVGLNNMNESSDGSDVTTDVLVNENDSTSSRSSETKNSSTVGLNSMNESSNGSDDTTSDLVNENDSTSSRASESDNVSTTSSVIPDSAVNKSFSRSDPGRVGRRRLNLQ